MLSSTKQQRRIDRVERLEGNRFLQKRLIEFSSNWYNVGDDLLF